MESLTQGIESAIQQAIEEYVQLISNTYDNVETDDLENIWNDVSKTMKISVSFKKAEAKSSTNKVSSENTGGCPYRFVKGAKKNQACGAKPREGMQYCSRHKKHEGTVQKERTVSPSVKNKKTQKNTIKPKSKGKSPDRMIKRVLVKHKVIGKLYHPESQLVFKSASDRVVIGKVVDDKLLDLTEKDIEECRRWSFSYEEKKEDEAEADDSSSSDEEEEKKDDGSHIYLLAKSSAPSGKKFWECILTDNSYTVRYGKLGGKGTSKTKTFDTKEAAVKGMEKAVKTKLKKGYEKSTPPGEEVEKKPKKEVKPVKTKPKKEVKPAKTKPKKEVKPKKKNSDSGEDSDKSVEEEIKELQENSGDDEENEVLGKSFISKALGLSGSSVTIEDVNSEDEDDDLVIEEFDED